MIRKQVMIQLFVTVTIIGALSFLSGPDSFGQSNSKSGTNPGKSEAQQEIQRLSKELKDSQEGPQRVKILLELSDRQLT